MASAGITHSFVMSVLESYGMAAKQIRWLSKILPQNWELVFVDDGSNPEIEIPSERPASFQLLRINQHREPGEWTQHEAINAGVAMARGEYFIKSDIDHIFTPEAIQAADSFRGDVRLFHRRAGCFNDNGGITDLNLALYSPVDDIYVMKKSLFQQMGGYPPLRKYGKGGIDLWGYSQKREAQPVDGALIYACPDTHEKYHSLERVHYCA